MLVKINDVLVPHDINRDMLDFVIKDEGASRFVVGMYIPEAMHGSRFAYDVCHIAKISDELRVHSQRTSRTYQLYMYAWEHVYCLMPSAKAKRKAHTGWIAPEATDAIDQPDFGATWYANDFRKFIKDNTNVTA